MGFDAERGDTFEISSSPFARAEEGVPAGEAPAPAAKPSLVTYAAIGGGALLALLVLFLALRGKKGAAAGELPITPGTRVAEIEAALLRYAGALPPASARPALTDPAASLRDRARELATKDPTRAAHILKAWMAQEAAQPSHPPPPHA